MKLLQELHQLLENRDIEWEPQPNFRGKQGITRDTGPPRSQRRSPRPTSVRDQQIHAARQRYRQLKQLVARSSDPDKIKQANNKIKQIEKVFANNDIYLDQKAVFTTT